MIREDLEKLNTSLDEYYTVETFEFEENVGKGKSAKNINIVGFSFPERSFSICQPHCGGEEIGQGSRHGKSWLREAILYQIGCFFTHCVNGP